MALSPDSRILAVGCYDHRVYLLGLSDHQVISVFTGHALAVRALAFSPDGRFLVSSATDRTVRLWELEQMTVRRVMQLDSWAESLVFLNQRIVIAGTVEGALQLVDIEHGVLLRRYDMHDWCVHQLFVSPSGDLVCSCSHDGTARVWRHSVFLHACTGQSCVQESQAGNL
jgi:WD40 repeat protein